MKDYGKMSDFEINQAVTCKLYGCHEWSTNLVGNFYHCGFDGSQYVEVTVADYCNNPSDAWPLIAESNIATRPLYIRDAEGRKIVEWEAKFTDREFPRNTIGWDDKNPLRAAMIVYLMMKDEEK